MYGLRRKHGLLPGKFERRTEFYLFITDAGWLYGFMDDFGNFVADGPAFNGVL